MRSGLRMGSGRGLGGRWEEGGGEGEGVVQGKRERMERK
jgi:hypothetical protein